MSAVEDRRQRAREAAKESHGDPDWFGLEASGPVNAAIETATRVQITDELIEQIMCNTGAEWGGEVRDIIEEFCSALGFEVVD